MLRKVFFAILIIAGGINTASSQTDSTDLDLYMTDAVLLTELDSMLYGDGTFDQLNLDFTVEDTVRFSKVHVTLEETAGSTVIFKKSYSVFYLESESLISSWDVRIPFGNLRNAQSYTVAIIVEEYDGSLGATITKTLTP